SGISRGRQAPAGRGGESPPHPPCPSRARQRLQGAELANLAGTIHRRQRGRCIFIPLLGGFSVPLDGFTIVLLYASPVGVDQTEVELSIGRALLGRHSVPLDGFAVVLPYALPVGVDRTETELSVSVPPLGGHSVPLDGFSLV